MLTNFLESYNFLPILAFTIDTIFGEFGFYHPVKLFGNFIILFEKKFYKDSIVSGGLLFISLLLTTLTCLYIIKLILPNYLWFAFEILLASSLLANNMLYKEVKKLALSANSKEKLKYLVSRDTQNLNESDVYKAAIETYAENLNDAVIAPLFYLCSFGIWGVVVYKCINTLDSMVGYRNNRYEKFGKISAKADDVVNFIPARISALIILAINNKLKYIRDIKKISKLYPSRNAAYSIGAFGYVLGICLGGPTYYFGKEVYKPLLGYGKCIIEKSDVFRALEKKRN